MQEHVQTIRQMSEAILLIKCKCKCQFCIPDRDRVLQKIDINIIAKKYTSYEFRLKS